MADAGGNEFDQVFSEFLRAALGDGQISRCLSKGSWNMTGDTGNARNNVMRIETEFARRRPPCTGTVGPREPVAVSDLHGQADPVTLRIVVWQE